MKSVKSIKSIIIVSAIILVSLFCINISLAMSKAKVIVETANIRENATEDAKILEQISLNDEVEILEKEQDWYKISYKGIKGYIKQELIAVNSDNKENVENQNKIENEENKEESGENNQEKTSTEEIKTIEVGKNKVIEDVQIKILPIINANNVGDVKKDEEVNVLEIINNWAYIQKENMQGWIIVAKLGKVEEKPKPVETTNTVENTKQETVIKTSYISGSTVNLRKEASTASESMARLSINTQVKVMSEENGWSKVQVNEKIGYISSSLLSQTKQTITSRGATTRDKTQTNTTKSNTNTTQATAKTTTTNSTANVTTSQAENGNSSKASEVVAYAKQYLGSKYVYGGASPSGFDCSGFTSYVYKHFGVSLLRTAAGQSGNGKSVSSLQAGDLVLFNGSRGSGIGHVGIYIGGNSFIHASTTKTGVIISSLSENYYKTRYVGARRIF